MILILLGAPGTGKGTQSSMLQESYDAIHISTGEILRNEVLEKTTIGDKIQSYINEGKLVPEHLINDIIAKHLKLLNFRKDLVVLDGYPRSIKQAEYLNNLVNDQDINVIFLDLNDVEIIKRITGRFSCPNCNKIYSKFYNKPKIEDFCDNCGKVDFVVRQDDNEQIIQKRIAEYNKETRPLVKFYNDKEILSMIPADQNKEYIHNEIVSLLKKA